MSLWSFQLTSLELAGTSSQRLSRLPTPFTQIVIAALLTVIDGVLR